MLEKSSAEEVKDFGEIVKIDEKKIQSHLDTVIRGTVEETLNALLEEEAKALCNAARRSRQPIAKGEGKFKFQSSNDKSNPKSKVQKLDCVNPCSPVVIKAANSQGEVQISKSRLQIRHNAPQAARLNDKSVVYKTGNSQEPMGCLCGQIGDCRASLAMIAFESCLKELSPYPSKSPYLPSYTKKSHRRGAF